jgi:hypothetical protein
MYLPDCILQLIKSFLPGPKPYEPRRFESYFFIDYVAIDDWADVADDRQYGDF